MNNNAYNFNENEEIELIPEGEYEVVLNNAEIRTAKKNGTQYVSLEFLIRGDVEQKCCNRKIWESVFKDKDESGRFDHRKLQKIILTQKNTTNFQTSFPDTETLLQYINGLYMRIYIEKNEADEYHEKEYNCVRYCSYKPSTVPVRTISSPSVPNTPIPQKNQNLAFEPEDLPF